MAPFAVFPLGFMLPSTDSRKSVKIVFLTIFFAILSVLIDALALAETEPL